MATDPSGPAPSAAQDWITIWQSECAALAVDRECQEAVQRMAAAWAAAASALLPDASGLARAAAPPRPAPPDAASPARDVAFAALAARVEQLERLLAGPAP